MIRIAAIEDLYHIDKICKEHTALHSTDKDSNYIHWLYNHLESHSPFYVYESNNKIIGFLLSEKMVGNGILLWMIGITDEYLNKGIGVKLYLYFENECKKLGIEWIITYGYMNNYKIEQLLFKGNFHSNGNNYREYLKMLK